MALIKIQYVGLSDVREMSVEDLAAAGVGVDRDLHFDVRNGWTQVVENPSDELLFILKKEGTFTVSDTTKADSKNRTIVQGHALDDSGTVVSIDDQSDGAADKAADAAMAEAAKK